MCICDYTQQKGFAHTFWVSSTRKLPNLKFVVFSVRPLMQTTKLIFALNFIAGNKTNREGYVYENKSIKFRALRIKNISWWNTDTWGLKLNTRRYVSIYQSWHVGVLKPDASIQQYQAQGTCSVNLYRMCEVFIESVKQLRQLIYALEG